MAQILYYHKKEGTNFSKSKLRVEKKKENLRIKMEKINSRLMQLSKTNIYRLLLVDRAFHTETFKVSSERRHDCKILNMLSLHFCQQKCKKFFLQNQQN